MGGGNLASLSSAENTMLGVAAGTIEVTLLQPMLYCKNATQQNLPLSVGPRYVPANIFWRLEPFNYSCELLYETRAGVGFRNPMEATRERF